MANIIYTKFYEQLLVNETLDFDAAGTVVRAILERNNSTYTPVRTHRFVSELNIGSTFIECDATISPTYARKTVATKAVSFDDPQLRVEWTFDPIAFGNLESGQIIKGMVLYVQVGGSDATPTDDPLICYIDTAGVSLPATLGGGPFTVTPNAQGVIQFAQG